MAVLASQIGAPTGIFQWGTPSNGCKTWMVAAMTPLCLVATSAFEVQYGIIGCYACRLLRGVTRYPEGYLLWAIFLFFITSVR